MRIAYICSDPGIPVSGTKGASIHLREVVGALKGLGHEVRVYSPVIAAAENSDPETFRAVTLSESLAEAVGTLPADVQTPHLANEYARLLYNEYLQHAVAAELETWCPHFVYERYSLFGYAGLELAGRLQVPLLLEVNAPLRDEQENYRVLALKQTAEQLERRVLNGAGALLVVSEPLAAFAASLGVPLERIEVLPNAVDPARFSPDVTPHAAARTGFAGEKLIGFVGSLKLWHDVDTLILAVRRLASKDPAYRLLLVGDGPRWDELQAVDAPFMRLFGPVDNSEVPSLLAAMDVVAVPYGAGGDAYFSPLKLFEAMAMARPVVGARTGQVPAVLSDGIDGLLYEPGDGADLARQIERVFSLPDRGASLGAAARARVMKSHTWARNAERIVERAESLMRAGAALGR